MDKSKSVEAEQGVRQTVKLLGQVDVLKPGDQFICCYFANKPVMKHIPANCLGLVHRDGSNEDTVTMSIVRDDCQAARRFLNKVK